MFSKSVYICCLFLSVLPLLGEPDQRVPGTSWVLNRLGWASRALLCLSVPWQSRPVVSGLYWPPAQPPCAESTSPCSLKLQSRSCGAWWMLVSEDLIWPGPGRASSLSPHGSSAPGARNEAPSPSHVSASALKSPPPKMGALAAWECASGSCHSPASCGDPRASSPSLVEKGLHPPPQPGEQLLPELLPRQPPAASACDQGYRACGPIDKRSQAA